MTTLLLATTNVLEICIQLNKTFLLRVFVFGLVGLGFLFCFDP